MEEVLNFLKDLKINNNKVWFDKNKERYLDIKTFVETFTQGLLNGISGFDPGAQYLTPKDCTYRIYRDTRFSMDKTPYKTHIGIFINPPYGKRVLGWGIIYIWNPTTAPLE